MTERLFGTWLEETRKLQVEAYGSTPGDKTGDDRAKYFSEMGFAAVVELGEMSNEVGWKSWGTDRTINKENYLKEGVDVLHFLANLLVMGNITDEELNEAYIAKMQVNRDRMARASYDGRVEGKCTRCRRSFDDVGESTVTDGLCMMCQVALEVLSNG